MKTEYEATFKINSKDSIRSKLKEAGAELLRPEFLQQRSVFDLPKGHEIENGWMRVRNEGDRITMTLKQVHNNTSIENQKEIEIEVSDFEKAGLLLEALGCERKAFQETLREIWVLDGVEVMIDEWPFLEPYIEIEGSSEESVKAVSEKLGFNYSEAYFGSVDGFYAERYGISEDRVNNETPEIRFDMENPFR